MQSHTTLSASPASSSSSKDVRPESAAERSRGRLIGAMSQADRLCQQLSRRLIQASVLWNGPTPTSPGGPQAAPTPTAELSLMQLEERIADMLSEANSLSDRLSEYLP